MMYISLGRDTDTDTDADADADTDSWGRHEVVPWHLDIDQKTEVSSLFLQCRFRSSDVAASTFTIQPSHRPHILLF